MRTLPPPPSSAGVPRTTHPAAELVGQRGGGQPGAEAGGGDDVVPAGVADAGQGVVLAAAPRRSGPSVPARAANAVVEAVGVRARRRGPRPRGSPVSRSWAKCSSKPSSGCSWIWWEASSSSVGPPVDLVAQPGLGGVEVHRASVGYRPVARIRPDERPVRRRRGRASGSTAHRQHVAAAADRARRRARRRAAARTSSCTAVDPAGRAGPGWGRWVPVGQPAPGLQPVAERQVAVGDVEQAVVGVRPGAEVPRRPATGRSWPRRPGPATTTAGRRGGPRTSAAARRRRTDAEVDREGHGLGGPEAGLVAAAAEGAAQVAAEQPERRAAAGRPGGPRSTTARASASVRTTTPSAGSGPGAPPGLALLDRHGGSLAASPAVGAVTVGADRRRGRDDAAEHQRRRPGGPRRPWRDRRRRRPTWRSRSMSCLALRTKSPPDSSSSSRTSSSGSPAAHAWARARKPGSGGRVERQARAPPRRR